LPGRKGRANKTKKIKSHFINSQQTVVDGWMGGWMFDGTYG
jgi:hypothetical protein